MDKFPLEKIDPQTLQERPSSGLNTSHDIISTALFQPLFSTAKMYQPSRLFQFFKTIRNGRNFNCAFFRINFVDEQQQQQQLELLIVGTDRERSFSDKMGQLVFT